MYRDTDFRIRSRSCSLDSRTDRQVELARCPFGLEGPHSGATAPGTVRDLDARPGSRGALVAEETLLNGSVARYVRTWAW